MVGIILLFVGIAYAPAIAQNTEKSQSSRGSWLYVGGSGPGNYSRIQDALDDSSDGNTVFVFNFSSPYYENIRVKKSVNLIGENCSNTIIIGDGQHLDVIYISADNVEISGFTLKNSHSDEFSAGIYIFSNYTLITDNILCENGNGVRVYSLDVLHHDIIISNNKIFNNIYCGVIFHGSEHCSVCDNEITSNKNGIRTLYSHDTKIIRNIIKNNSWDGINFLDSHIMLVELNNLSNNKHGIFSWTGSSHGVFQNNTMNSNVEDGVFIGQEYAKGDFLVKNNIIKFNGRNGIRIQFSNKNIVQENEIIGNTNGLYLLGADRNKIQGNNFTNNIGYGVLIKSDYERSFFNEFSYNNFIGNSVNAHDECRNIWFNIWKTKGNYWDDYTGIDNDGDGIGDTTYTIEGGKNKDRYPLMESCDNFTSYTKNNQYVYQIINKWWFSIILDRFLLLHRLLQELK